MNSKASASVSRAASGSPMPWSSRRAMQIRGIGSSLRISDSERYCAIASSTSPRASASAAASMITSGCWRSTRRQRSRAAEAASSSPASSASKPRARSEVMRSVRDIVFPLDTPNWFRALARSFAEDARGRYCRAVTRFLVVIALVLSLGACPRHTRKTLVPDVPQNGAVEARTRFAEAKAKFLRDGRNTDEFRQIAEDFPDDPITPWAHLYAGIAAVKARQFDAAIKALQATVDADVEGLGVRAQLFLGIAYNYAGNPGKAVPLLRAGEKAIENDDERTEYLAALAYATSMGEQPLAALPVFDQLYSRVTPTEKALIVERVGELVAAANPDTLRRLYDEIDDKKGPSMAHVAS